MLKINELARLYLGIQGENGVRSITVDVSAWINLYPNGSVTVWHKRCGDSTPSPTGAVYDSEEQTVTWDITSVDTFVAGIGEAEFRLIENEVIKKTTKVMTGVSPSVTQSGTTLGSDWQSYINAVDSLRAGAVVAQEAAEDAQEAAEDAQEAAEDAQEAAEDAQTAAETAQGKAEDAQTAAEAAAARAEHASKVMVPAGGTEGQRLAKKSGTDFDMEWKTDPYYTKPAGGIPASDMAEGVIPDPEDLIDDTAGAGDTNKVWSADKSADLMRAIQQKYTKPSTGIPASDLASGVIPAVPVTDVQIDGNSILSSGVANIPVASDQNVGVVKCNENGGIGIVASTLYLKDATSEAIKEGTDVGSVLKPKRQHEATFYGLAKASGDATQSSSSNAVGVYTESAKSSIAQMLDAPETVSGTTPSITAKAGVRYVCGECATLSITAPASGCIDVVFASGSTATVLTVISAKSNTTIKWANGFDPTSLEANTTYELNILDGEFGVVGSWT